MTFVDAVAMEMNRELVVLGMTSTSGRELQEDPSIVMMTSCDWYRRHLTLARETPTTPSISLIVAYMYKRYIHSLANRIRETLSRTDARKRARLHQS